MQNKSILIALGILVLGILPAFAQTPQIASVYHDVHVIESKVLDEKRSIWVRVPLKYHRGKHRYPVVYMLDGHSPHPSMMVGILDQQALGRKMPEMILVSIQNTRRGRDMTPPVGEMRRNLGGADKFLKFIETEVIPLVESKYRIAPYRVFAGHSLGGLTVIYSLVRNPKLFNAYIAASPVLHYRKNYIVKETEKFFTANRKLETSLFMALGDEPEYFQAWKRYKKLLKNRGPSKFRYGFKDFEDENHVSVVLPSYYWGLRNIFRGWEPPPTGDVSRIESHYRALTKKFGFNVFPPEDLMNQIGYRYLQAGNFFNAIRVLKQNAENYPDSANVYDSLGEAYEKSGSKKLAAENYRKAVALAGKLGESLVLERYKQNLRRVTN